MYIYNLCTLHTHIHTHLLSERNLHEGRDFVCFIYFSAFSTQRSV